MFYMNMSFSPSRLVGNLPKNPFSPIGKRSSKVLPLREPPDRPSDVSGHDLISAAAEGDGGRLKSIISSTVFSNIYSYNIGQALRCAATKVDISCLKGIIKSVRFHEISIDDLGLALENAVTSDSLPCVNLIIEAPRFSKICLNKLRKCMTVPTKPEIKYSLGLAMLLIFPENDPLPQFNSLREKMGESVLIDNTPATRREAYSKILREQGMKGLMDSIKLERTMKLVSKDPIKGIGRGSLKTELAMKLVLPFLAPQRHNLGD
jgi:hypothetical protein